MNDETDGDAGDDWGAALAEQAEAEAAGGEAPAEAAPQPEGEPYTPPPLAADGAGSSGDINLDALVDIPVTISMEIGRTTLSIRNLLQLNQGSVVELDRLAGEPMDVLVNGTLVAHGEVVVVNEKFGVRLTDVISAQDRIKKLR